MWNATSLAFLWLLLVSSQAAQDPSNMTDQEIMDIFQKLKLWIELRNSSIINAGEGSIEGRRMMSCPHGVSCEPAPPTPEITTTDYPTYIFTFPTIPPSTPPPRNSTCGQFLLNISERGSFGVEAEQEEYPWTVAVYSKRSGYGDGTYKYSCAGSLIHHRAVLTAFHCIRRTKAEDLMIRAGVHDLTDDDDNIWESQENLVTEIVKHEHYRTGTKANNVAILILQTEIRTGNNIGFVCLPAPAMLTAPGTECQVTGWGVSGGYILERRKTVDLPIVDKLTCMTALHNIRGFNKKFVLPESTLCAGGEEGVDTCRGDGGAALVCNLHNESDRYYQAGITSWGVGCGVASRPGMYTSVSAVRSWIDQKMKERNLSTDTYTI